jgi:hypothetical protein
VPGGRRGVSRQVDPPRRASGVLAGRRPSARTPDGVRSGPTGSTTGLGRGLRCAWLARTAHGWPGLRTAAVDCAWLARTAHGWPGLRTAGPDCARLARTAHGWPGLRTAGLHCARLGCTAHGCGGLRMALAGCEVARRGAQSPSADTGQRATPRDVGRARPQRGSGEIKPRWCRARARPEHESHVVVGGSTDRCFSALDQ